MAKYSSLIFVYVVGATLLHQVLSTVPPWDQCKIFSTRWKDLGGDFCYIVESDATATWMDAAFQCSVQGGSLASFHSLPEIQSVVQHINKSGEAFHIGLRIHHDGALEWVDKSAVEIRNWSPGEPNFNFEKCVEMYSDNGKWNDIKCDKKRGYVCSRPKNTPLSDSRKTCPFHSMQWFAVGDRCFIVENDHVAIRDHAIYDCISEGGDIASFYSLNEISQVLQRTKEMNIKLHIGLEKDNTGKYLWHDGSRTDLDFWKSGEPHDSSAECGAMDSNTGYWEPMSCRSEAGYICSAEKSRCGGLISSSSGFIHSPNFPEPYENLQYCTWYIEVPEDKHATLQFLDFDVESSDNCWFDYVMIYDWNRKKDPVLGRFCGSNIPPEKIQSSSNILAIRLVTDSSVQKRGFRAVFGSVVPPVVPAPERIESTIREFWSEGNMTQEFARVKNVMLGR